MFGVLYNILFPIALILSLPAWFLKIRKRKGFGTGIRQRFAIYKEKSQQETKGVTYIHAVSVGETFIALKLIKKWLTIHPDEQFVLAVTTPTAHAVASKSTESSVRIIYSPFDFPLFVNKVLNRFQPKKIILIESEIWYNFINNASRRSIPVFLANARLSHRSEKRYKKLAFILGPLLNKIEKVFIQYESDRLRWESIGLSSSRITKTGSIKFDYDQLPPNPLGESDQKTLDSLAKGREIIILVSTSKNEEAYLAKQLKSIAETHFLVVVPRHEERREEVISDLVAAGYNPFATSQRKQCPETKGIDCVLVDETGVLTSWLASSSIAIIGKSWLGSGGQNPIEPILSGLSVIVGPNMQNFEDIISRLVDNNAIEQLNSGDELLQIIKKINNTDSYAKKMNISAMEVLDIHLEATTKTINNISAVRN